MVRRLLNDSDVGEGLGRALRSALQHGASEVVRTDTKSKFMKNMVRPVHIIYDLIYPCRDGHFLQSGYGGVRDVSQFDH